MIDLDDSNRLQNTLRNKLVHRRRSILRKIALRLLLLSLAAAVVIGTLPPPGQPASARAATQTTARRRTRTPSIVPLGTNLRVRLNDTLSSKDSRVGDRFTATVINPSRYEGA